MDTSLAEEFTANILEQAIALAPKVIVAIVLLLIGFWIIARVVNFAVSGLQNRGVDISLRKFLGSFFSIALKVMLILSVANFIGIKTTSFVAIFSALMIGVGMALNGSIGHLASGIMIMIFKPFKVNDLVVIGGGNTGTVESINAFNTTLKTLDNKRIIIANSNVTGNDITNVSGQGIVGVELTFGIGYGDNIDKARKVILEVGQSCPHIISDPEQKVFVSNLGDSSVDLVTRPFCKSENFHAMRFYMIEHVKKAFDAQGIGIPYQTLDVNLIGGN